MKNCQVSLLGMYLSSYEKCKHLHFWLMFFSTTEESPMKFYSYFLAKTFYAKHNMSLLWRKAKTI